MQGVRQLVTSHSVQDLSLWGGTSHSQEWLNLSGNKSLMPQELGSHGDSKFSQIDEEDEGLRRRPLCWELLSSSHAPGEAHTGQ